VPWCYSSSRRTLFILTDTPTPISSPKCLASSMEGVDLGHGDGDSGPSSPSLPSAAAAEIPSGRPSCPIFPRRSLNGQRPLGILPIFLAIRSSLASYHAVSWPSLSLS
jgi:hypothetical protein